MNREKVQQEINNVIETFRSNLHPRQANRQYPVAKWQLVKLEELGILDLMPKNFGHGDAGAVIEAAEKASSAIMNAFGEGEEVAASALHEAVNEDTEETVKRSQIKVGQVVRIKDHTRYDWQVHGTYATLVKPTEHHIYGGQHATIHAIYVDEMEDENMNPVYEYTVALDGFGLFDISELELV